MVSPRMASLMLRMTPRALSTPTTSPAMVLIQAMETTKPRKHRRVCQRGVRFGLVVARMKANKTSETVREMSEGRRSQRGLSENILAQTITTMKKGAVKICRMTSHRFQSSDEENGSANCTEFLPGVGLGSGEGTRGGNCNTSDEDLTVLLVP
jgi:hypothetical protein